MTEPRAPSFNDVLDAAHRIAPMILRTPVRSGLPIDATLGCQAWFKCENLQKTGAFKMRGAANAVLHLREQNNESNVATHSSGNHGTALARAARLDGRRAHVVMPANAVQRKIDAVRNQGAEVILCEPTQRAREAGLEQLVKQGLIPIPPYDHPDIIAGQGTAALELLDDHEDLDVILTPVGGGGLVSGTAIAAHGVSSRIEIIAAEPAGAADTAASLARGKRVSEWKPDTIADGLRAVVGELTFPVIKAEVGHVLTVSERGIVNAVRFAFESLGMAVEPSAAIVLGAILEYPERFQDRRVGVIISGGNADPSAFPFLDQDG